MGFANKTHWIGVFLLFAASILLLITTITAPVINHISLLHVELPQGSSINFGTFGYCVINGNDNTNYCSKKEIGYKPAHVVEGLVGGNFHEITSGTDDALTNVFVLHPIECGIAFLAFLIACGAGIVGSFIGAIVALLAWILTLISLAIDFTVFGILHHHVNDLGNGSKATYGSGLWCLVGAFAALFVGMFIVFFTCCANRREKKRNSTRAVKHEGDVGPGTPRRRKRFGLF